MPDEPQIPKNWPDGQESTPAEKWAWDEIHAGRIADFNDHYGKVADPNKPKDWDDDEADRRLSAAFLVTILTEEKYRKATPYQGVRISGAYFDEAIDLEHARIDCQLWLVKCWIKGKMSLYDLHVGGVFSLEKSRIGGAVDLSFAVLESAVSLMGSTLDDGLNMNGIDVGQNLHMEGKAIFEEVDLTGAKIGGQLSMDGGIFKSALNMNSIEVGRSLHMHGGAAFQDVDLSTAKIGSNLSLDDSEFKGALSLESIEIGRDLFARGTTFSNNHGVNVIFAVIGSFLDLSGATIAAIDLSGSTIAGELRLGSGTGGAPTNWTGASTMNLRNSTVGAIHDADPDRETDSWPKNLELAGFSCRHLGGLGAGAAADMAKRSSKWFIEWLKDKTTFSPHPYEMFAKLLRDVGYPSKANDLLYAGRERARAEAWKKREGKPREWRRSIGMSLLQYTIGYGLGARYFRALWWVGGLTIIGFSLLWTYLPEADQEVFTLLGASFERLLPLAEFDESHKDLFDQISLPGWVWFYFYVHKLAGYVLASFLIAGLAGLTQKS